MSSDVIPQAQARYARGDQIKRLDPRLQVFKARGRIIGIGATMPARAISSDDCSAPLRVVAAVIWAWAVPTRAISCALASPTGHQPFAGLAGQLAARFRLAAISPRPKSAMVAMSRRVSRRAGQARSHVQRNGLSGGRRARRRARRRRIGRLIAGGAHEPVVDGGLHIGHGDRRGRLRPQGRQGWFPHREAG